MAKNMRLHSIFISVFALNILCFAGDDPFQAPPELEGRVQFWIRIFTEFSLEHIIIHDAEVPERIYRILDFRELKERGVLFEQQKQDSIRKAKEEVRGILNRLCTVQDTSQLNSRELGIRRLFKSPSSAAFYTAANQLHVQKGAVETFKAGLIRSGRYIPSMMTLFREANLPEDLVYLAHVESAFHLRARSPAGALGIWQFMPSTGKGLLQINSLIDERRDPILSTRAAASLLQTNFDKTGNWALAITAYNHGVNGMIRAAQSTGSRDIIHIIERYQSSTFGYASKNFYAEFLAVRHIAKNPGDYFPDIELDQPLQFKLVTLPFAFSLREVARMFQVDPDVLAELNPALNQIVTVRGKKMPRGTTLRLPLEAHVMGAEIIQGIGVTLPGL
jgi:membrane-bound lytic murein transglycosylase D